MSEVYLDGWTGEFFEVPDYPDNEAEEAAYAYLELMHKHFVCGWKEHERACQRLCEVFGFDGWEHWRGTRE